MESSDLFGESPFTTKHRLESVLLESFDSFPQCRLPKSLFCSLVSALLRCCPGEHLSRSQFEILFAIVKSKVAHGEPALASFVGKKEEVDLSDEWIFRVNAEYVAPVVHPKQRTILFSKGDAADCCFVIVKGSVAGTDAKGATCGIWGENDVLGLDEMLLRQKSRSFSAWIEPSAGADPFLTQPLLLRIAASSFGKLEPRDLLHFFAGALQGRRFGVVAALCPSEDQKQHPKGINLLPTQFVSQGSVVIEKGSELKHVFYVCEGQLESSDHQIFGPKSIVCLSEYLSTDRKVAKQSIKAATSCVRTAEKKKKIHGSDFFSFFFFFS